MTEVKHGIILENEVYKIVSFKDDALPPNLILTEPKDSRVVYYLPNGVRLLWKDSTTYGNELTVSFENHKLEYLLSMRSLAGVNSIITHYSKKTEEDIRKSIPEEKQKILSAEEKRLTESVEKLKEQETSLKVEVERLSQLKKTADELLAKTEKFVEVYKELAEAVDN